MDSANDTFISLSEQKKSYDESDDHFFQKNVDKDLVDQEMRNS